MSPCLCLYFSGLACRNPSLLLLDEPTSGLDSKMSDSLMRDVKQITEQGCTVIATIHQPSDTLPGNFVNMIEHLDIDVFDVSVSHAAKVNWPRKLSSVVLTKCFCSRPVVWPTTAKLRAWEAHWVTWASLVHKDSWVESQKPVLQSFRCLYNLIHCNWLVIAFLDF